MNRERLTKLAEFLDNMPEDGRFSLLTWVNGLRSINHPCGFVACAVGWATTIPEFREQGLCMSYNAPKFDGKTDWWAVEAFFEITHEQSRVLFAGDHYAAGHKGPKDVAQRIREVLEE